VEVEAVDKEKEMEKIQPGLYLCAKDFDFSFLFCFSACVCFVS